MTRSFDPQTRGVSWQSADGKTLILADDAESIAAMPLVDLLGRGQLLLSLDMPSMREPYQSIVPLDGTTIAAVFEHYLQQSEQLASRFFLASSAHAAAGLFLQKMPTTDQRDTDGWARIEALAGTVTPGELLGLDSAALLTRLFHEETVRLFAARPATNDCPPDWDKIRNMLLALGREDVYGALKEHGAIVIHDELSNNEYRFDKATIDALFSRTPETPKTVH